MKNKNVGYLIVGISILICIIIIIFNLGLTSIVNQTCDHGPSCSMYGTIKTQTLLSLALAGFILIIGLFLVFSRENERVVIKRIKPHMDLEPKKFNKKLLENLSQDETNIMKIILENKGSIFQSELVEKSGFNKVKTTRVLDSLEAQGLIERKRRGMTNIVILKKNE